MTDPLYASWGQPLGTPPKKQKNPPDAASLHAMFRNTRHRRRRLRRQAQKETS